MHPDVARSILNFAFAKGLVVLGISPEAPLSRDDLARIVTFLRRDPMVLHGLIAAVRTLGHAGVQPLRTPPRWFKQPVEEEDFNFRKRPSLAHLRKAAPAPAPAPQPFVSKRGGGQRAAQDAHYARAESVASSLLTEYHQKRRLSRIQAMPKPADMPSQTPGPSRPRLTPST